MRDCVQQVVMDEHAGAHAIGIFDETSDLKKGDKTPGVQKQWCGRLGKTENCIVRVHLSLARTAVVPAFRQTEPLATRWHGRIGVASLSPRKNWCRFIFSERNNMN